MSDLFALANVIVHAVAWRQRGLPVPEASLLAPSTWHLWLAGRDVGLPQVALTLARRHRVRQPIAAAMLLAALNGAMPDHVLAAGVAIDLELGPVLATFGPAVARPWQEISATHQVELIAGGRYVATPKLDGVRCQVVLLPGRREVLSRQAERIEHCDELLTVLGNAFRDVPCVLDGELLAHDGTWSTTISALHGKKPARFHAFDLVPAEEVKRGAFALKAAARWTILDSLAPWDRSDLIAPVPREFIASIDEAEALTDRYIAKGYEGAVLHSSIATYHPRASKAWLKIKRWQSAELTVIDLVAGEGAMAGSCGALVVAGTINGLTVRCAVGAGLTRTQRDQAWKSRSAWLGMRAEIRFGSVTADGSLRWPTFLRLRDHEQLATGERRTP